MHAGHWVKTRFKGEEAVATVSRAHTEGYQSHGDALNEGADALARNGTSQHDEDPGNNSLRRWWPHQVKMYWHYAVQVYKLVGSQRQVKDDGFIVRTEKEGLANWPGKERTERHWQRQHALTQCGDTSVCVCHMRAHIAQREAKGNDRPW